MKVDISKIALVVVMIAGIQTSVLYHRVNDLECQRDIYKSRYEDWEGVSKEIAEYADTLRDSLKARDRLDGKLLVGYGKMDGKYFVDQMEHSISPSSGYKTQVKASKVEKEDFA